MVRSNREVVAVVVPEMVNAEGVDNVEVMIASLHPSSTTREHPFKRMATNITFHAGTLTKPSRLVLKTRLTQPYRPYPAFAFLADILIKAPSLRTSEPTS